MRLHRFIGKFNLEDSSLTVTEASLLHQWQNVLRLVLNDEVILSNGEGTEARATIVAIKKDKIELHIKEKHESIHEPKNEIYLYACIIKKDSFEWLAQKSVECGVKSITPLISERTIKTKLDEIRLAKIMREAAEQSFRALVPRLFPILTFETAVTEAKLNSDIFYICDTTFENTAKEKRNKEERRSEQKIDSRPKISVFIGPEGGFSKEEIAFAEKKGAKKLSLGKSILRSETAAIVAVHKLASA